MHSTRNKPVIVTTKSSRHQAPDECYLAYPEGAEYRDLRSNIRKSEI